MRGAGAQRALSGGGERDVDANEAVLGHNERTTRVEGVSDGQPGGNEQQRARARARLSLAVGQRMVESLWARLWPEDEPAQGDCAIAEMILELIPQPRLAIGRDP